MNYRYQKHAAFTFPIVAFGARQDDMVYLDEIGPWSKETTGGFKLVEVDGDHWFLNRNRELILEKLREIGYLWTGSAEKRVTYSPECLLSSSMDERTTATHGMLLR